jgi:3-oxoacyl-[acyl-carrier protein] reductase
MLSGKTAFITGATKGIGAAIATEFARQGANLILIARKAGELNTAKENIQKQFPNSSVTVFEADIADHQLINNIAKELNQQKIEIDILVNNAGVMADGMLMMLKPDAMRQNIDVNLFGTIYVTQALIKSFIKKRNGSIINITSIIGTNGNAGQSVYSASKSGIIGFTKSMSKELASLNIRVNAIAPGFIETDLVKNVSEQAKEKTLQNIGMKRFGKPEDVAKVALFLASDLSAYVTGQVIGVDGGMII